MTIHPNLYIQVHHSKSFTQPPVVPNFNSVHWLFFLEKLDERSIFTKEDRMSTCQGFRKLANGFTEFGCMFWKGCLEKKIINYKKRKHFDHIFELWQVVMGRMTLNKTAILRENYLKTLYLKNCLKTLRKNYLKHLGKMTLKHLGKIP